MQFSGAKQEHSGLAFKEYHATTWHESTKVRQSKGILAKHWFYLPAFVSLTLDSAAKKALSLSSACRNLLSEKTLELQLTDLQTIFIVSFCLCVCLVGLLLSRILRSNKSEKQRGYPLLWRIKVKAAGEVAESKTISNHLVVGDCERGTEIFQDLEIIIVVIAIIFVI